MSRTIAPFLALLALMVLGAACGKVIEIAPPPGDTSNTGDTSNAGDTGTSPETVTGEDIVAPDLALVCDEATELLCESACAPCPTDPGVTERACLQGDCVATGCEAGFRVCEGTCCRWNVSSPDQSGFTGRNVRIAVDQDQRTHLVFHWMTASPPMPGIRWLRDTATGWQSEEVSSGGNLYLDFVLDQALVPRVVYNGHQSGMGGFALAYKDEDGSGWLETGWPDATVNPISVVSCQVAVDGLNMTRAVFRDQGLGRGELKHAVRDFAGEWPSWPTEVVEVNVQMDLPEHSESLVVDTEGRSHVAFVDGVMSNLGYSVQGVEGDGWLRETLFEGPALSPSLALDTAGRPLVAFAAPERDEIILARWDGAWQTEVIASARTDQIVLAVGPNDEPHVAYANQREDGRLEYARRTLLGWRFSVVDDETEIDALDLALDADGNPRIAYHDVGRDRVMLALW